ncbi:uncharacterized protein DUF4124 [Tamilnaduibacter salinus]|uniref:DUF4124 domain-containing protein n=1 Tax=Tamilnaduibacter salinus TaxID=1484056 RepID=A0A2A2HZF1_9GAMM|nr:DUF4124 domain-containing protein [Tamilnaduibacter salinus]PAV24692.1 DUF4124 domain-containing protein [Tamilnaduibacter salinus]PVY79057.1 uncharacterized protein DUF4124 [Tamilnaduibacter salinus]
MRKETILALTLCLFPTLAAAEVYQWTDENGRTHFGDRPPQSQSSKSVSINTAEPVGTDRDRQEKLNQFLEERREAREAEREERRQAEAEAAKQAKRCKKLSGYIKHQKSVSRFYRITENGEREYLSEEKAQALRERNRARYEKECG